MNGERAQFHQHMEFFSTASYFHPGTAADVKPTTDVILARITNVPALSQFAGVIGAEWPLYIAAVEDIESSVHPLK